MSGRAPAVAGFVTVLLAALLGLPAAPAGAAGDPPPLPDPLGLLAPPPDRDDPRPPPVPGAPVPRAPADEPDLRTAIVTVARQEVGARRSREGAGDCVFYNRDLDGAHPCGIQWCTQFVRWVWREAGADVAGLDYRPASLRTYGRGHGTWHPGKKLAGLQKGDAVVFRLGQPGRLGHANIVVAVHGKRVTTVGGNEAGAVRRTTWRIGDERRYGYVSGYTSPVPRD